MTVGDPNQSLSFLYRGRPAKPSFCEIELYEAAVGDLALPGLAVEWEY